MVVGDSNGRPVAVPVVLILALVERVQRMASSSSSSAVKGHGPQVGKRGDVARERQTEKHTYIHVEGERYLRRGAREAFETYS